MIVGRDEQVVALASALFRPGLSVVTGGPGAGKTATVRHAARRAERVVREAGALAGLSTVPGLPLSRAIRAAVPTDDPALAVEAVRMRVGDAVLLVDDAHWADRYTLSLLPELARHLSVVATVRLPGPLAPTALAALRHAADHWCALPPLDDDAAARVVTQVRAGLPDAAVRALVARCGGNPLALRVLARAWRPGGEPAEVAPEAGPLRGVAEMVAELPQAERTALAALGLLGRPVPAALPGPGVAGLVRVGLAKHDPATGLVAPTERFVAEVAAGVLPDHQRRALHRGLAALLDDDGEAARHLAAAGDRAAAAERALRAARAATGDLRADNLVLAVTWADGRAEPDLVLDAAEAALDTGRPALACRLLRPLTPADPVGRVRRSVLLSEALIGCGQPGPAHAALHEVAAELSGVDVALRARHATASVYAALADDPEAACVRAAAALADLGPAAPPRLWASYGAALLRAGRPDWQDAVRTALHTARAGGDHGGEWAAGAVLVAGLRDACRTGEARALATELADRAAAVGAYTPEVTFRAEALWAGLHADGVSDDLLRLAGTLLDRATPPDTRALLAATVALAQADTGAIPAARAVLHGHTAGPPDGDPQHVAGRAPAERDRLLRWVAAETAWLDGDPAGAVWWAGPLTGQWSTAGSDLAADLALLTLAWSARDRAVPAGPDGASWPEVSAAVRPPVRTTLGAWQVGGPAEWCRAAGEWAGVMTRERVRCLLAAGESGGGLDCLLAAEREADRAGLVLLRGRARRALRARGVTRGPAGPGGPGGLSAREHEVLDLVGRGYSTRRIAELLGLTRNTAETYVRQAMAKLGARTRTEAAVRAAGMARDGRPETGTDGGGGVSRPVARRAGTGMRVAPAGVGDE